MTPSSESICHTDAAWEEKLFRSLCHQKLPCTPLPGQPSSPRLSAASAVAEAAEARPIPVRVLSPSLDPSSQAGPEISGTQRGNNKTRFRREGRKDSCSHPPSLSPFTAKCRLSLSIVPQISSNHEFWYGLFQSKDPNFLISSNTDFHICLDSFELAKDFSLISPGSLSLMDNFTGEETETKWVI